MTDSVTVERTDDILGVRLAAPATRNAQSPTLWRELARIGETLPADVRAVILAADGPSFSAGLDRRMFTPDGIPGEGSMLGFAALPPAELDELIAQFQRAFLWWRRCSVPTIAAVQGHAVGAGFQLALGADMIVVADDVAFSMKEPSLGLVPDLGGTLPLVEAVGYGRALEMVLSGRWVGAEEAVRVGLALRAVPRDELDEAALELARSCSAAAPGAVAATKALLRDALHPDGFAAAHDEQVAAERAAQGERIRDLVALLTGR